MASRNVHLRNRQRHPRVKVNVYDLMDNSYGHYFGFGVYHSGIELDGIEYSFGGHDYDWTGVYTIEPRAAVGVKYRESVDIGDVVVSPQEMEVLVEELSAKYLGNTYHMLNRNCNHFSNELCERLTGISIPGYINRLAYLGSLVPCVLPPHLAANRDTPNATNQHLLAVSNETPRALSFNVFSGSGLRLSENTNSNHDSMYEEPSYSNDISAGESSDAKLRRERLAAAAAKRFGSL